MTSSWVSIPADSDFSLQNLPFGVFSVNGSPARCGVAIGNDVVDLSALAGNGVFANINGLEQGCFSNDTLNAFMAHPRAVWQAIRARLTDLLKEGGDDTLRSNATLRAVALVPLTSVTMHMPAKIGDYTDFYSSREHATNVGTMFRGADNALQPNWLHLPVGYHGRASSVYLDGTPITRPRGQLQKSKTDPKEGSVYGDCKLMDFELEMAFFVGGAPSKAGVPITMDQAEDRIFGLVVMNDWSARDIQKWEYIPLGPFGAKNFATTISPWIVTLDALEPFRCKTSAVEQKDPVPLPYLQDKNYSSYDVNLEVQIQGENMSKAETVSKSNFRNLYWNVKQQLVHHSVTGCNMQPGDLLGSGTISGTPQTSFGSMLELCWKGTREVPLGDSGEVRKFLRDGDTVTMTGFCEKDGVRVGFGSAGGKILPAGVTPEEEKEQSRFTNLKLSSYWRSSSSWRVRVALAAKGIPCEIVPVNLLKAEQKGDAYKQKNALAQVPALEVTDTTTGATATVTQSLAIIEFLEDAFPSHGCSMYPGDAVQRARAREMAEVVNSGTQPLQNLSTWKKIAADSKGAMDGRAFGADAIRTGLAALEGLVPDNHTGPFACGSTPSVADACIVPQLYNARRFDVDLSKFPKLLKVEAACATHPWFVAAHPDNQVDAQPQEPPKKKARK